MDETVSLAKVKVRLGELTALAAAGEEVVITKAPRALPAPGHCVNRRVMQ